MNSNTAIIKRKEQYTYVCLNCNKTYYPKEKNRDKYCSRECSYAHKKAKPKLCKVCGKDTDGSFYCSDKCKVSHDCECSICGCIFQARKGTKYCSDECRLEMGRIKFRESVTRNYQSKIYECIICGEHFTTEYGDKSRAYCSDECRHEGIRRQSRIQEYNREKRLRKAFVSKVVPQEIFKRDGFKCMLCDEPLAMDKKVPHPAAPTIDHIIPLAKGGTHEPSNVQAAHFKCNWMKSDRLIEKITEMK